MFAPLRFMLWSMKILPVRSAIFQAIVTRSGSAPRMSRPHAPTNARTCSYVYVPRSTGTKICRPVAPEVFGKAVRPSWSSSTLMWRATVSTSS